MKIDDIGIKIAKSIVDFFKDEENLRLIKSLKSYGIQFEILYSNRIKSAILNNMVFVISGVFEEFTREELKDQIKQNGGNVSSSISKRTSFLIAGINPGPSKINKAEKIQVPIIKEDEFIKMINLTES